LQQVVLRMQRHNPAEDRLALVAASAVLRDDSRSDLNFLSDAEDTRQDRTTRYTTLQVIHFRARFVHVERTDDDQPGIGGEIADGDGDPFDDVFVDGVDVVFELGRYRDDGGGFCDGSCKRV